MPLPLYLQLLLKSNYLYYRRAKAMRSGRISPQMQARMNVLNSQLATRARVPQSALLDLQKGSMESQLRTQKTAQRQENIDLAVNTLITFLHSGTGESKAYGLKQELDWLGNYLVSKSPQGTRWIPGPLKTVEKAMSKTDVDYGFAWGQNKDLVRSTLGCASNEDLKLVSNYLKQTCVPEYGMFLVKQDFQESTRDGGTIPTGYSGWNFAIQFKDHPEFPVEVQANTFDMLYGKMSKESYMKQFAVSEDAYKAIQLRLKFPGGLGHALYDISDTARAGTTDREGTTAKNLALDYYDACRGKYKFTTLQQMTTAIMQMGPQLTTAKAKELWKHAVEGSAWSQAIPLA